MPYLTLALMALVTALGVWSAERWLKGRPWTLGIFFGVLAILANSCSLCSVAEYGTALSLRDAPVIVAALFFGPLPGFIAGAIAASECALLPLVGVGAATWCPVATFLVALVAGAMKRWFFDGKRPYIVQALMLGVIFEALHLAFDILMGLDDLSRGCETVFSAFGPESFGLSLALVLSCLCLRQTGSFSSLWRSSASRLLLALLGCGSVVIGSISVWAEYDSRRMVKGCVRRLDHLFDSQIECLLHTDAAWISNKLADPAGRTPEGFSRFLDDEDYDEINAVGLDGRVFNSNRKNCIGFDFASDEKTRPYLKLLDGGAEYYGEPFRRSVVGKDGHEIKYAAAAVPGVGFIQLGFYRSRFESEFKRFFFPMFSGFMNFFETDYNIIASTNDWRIALANGGHGGFVGKPVSAVGIRPGRQHARIDGEWCHIGEKRVGEWCIFCVVPLVESYGEAMVNNSVLILVLSGLVFGFRLVNLRMRRQQRKIERLRAEMDEKRRQDLELGAKIQRSCLPLDLPSERDFAITARMRPAREVGGDFYDCYRFDDGRIVFAVADVSGKGVPAAMFMIQAKLILKSAMFRCADPAMAVAEANDRLERRNDAQMFVTAWLGVYDPKTGVVEYVNAGHNPPLVRRADGSVEWLRSRGGIALGMFSDCRYRIERVTLERGDKLFLYTDGVTEAQDPQGGFYGEARLAELLAAADGDLVESVFADVDAFALTAEQADDITVLALELKS